ncbi:hypothetical protein SAMN03159341_103237 [Paenibacillus sp. 1_12]|nr:uracil-DNA glycosylase [Paenibacillus sp. 1_12]SFL10665.1 hypothetical protein SAMN03159341_103237 [Paenibacillus sp. 1_12]
MKEDSDKASAKFIINCIKCVHYYVTWDPAFPRGCKAFGFKTAEMPSTLVKRSSGHPCLKFESKS